MKDTPPPVKVAEESRRPEPGNLLDLGRGVVVLDRSGEASLDASAIYAIDGDSATAWSTPPGDIQQTVMLELPAETDVTAVGFTNEKAGSRALGSVRFEGSIDGSAFESMTVAKASGVGTTELSPVRARARFIRASIVSGVRAASTIDVPSLQLRGREMELPSSGSISGTWRLNGDVAQLRSEGAHLTGVVNLNPPMLIDGGFDGRLYRFHWVRGPQYGVGVLTVARDGGITSGLWWFEECNPQKLGAPWFGKKISDAVSLRASELDPAPILARTGRYPLYAVKADQEGQIDPVASGDGIRQLVAFLASHPTRQFRIEAGEGSSASTDIHWNEKQLESLKNILSKEKVDMTRLEVVPRNPTPASQNHTEIEATLAGAIVLVDPQWKKSGRAVNLSNRKPAETSPAKANTLTR